MDSSWARPPLDGVVVADFSRAIAGPVATMTLGDLGAGVIKVERPGIGDETRSWRPPTTEDGQSTYFLAVNRNTRSIALDLSTKEGCLAAKTLVRGADVPVQNFAPATMEQFGLRYEELAIPRRMARGVAGPIRLSRTPLSTGSRRLRCPNATRTWRASRHSPRW